MLFPQHIKAARNIIGISQSDLSKLTIASLSTIKRMESSEEFMNNLSNKYIRSIRKALENKGIKFLYSKDEDSMEGIGIRYYPSLSLENKEKED